MDINGVNSNIFKVSIIFDDNRFHNKYKKLIENLYNKLYKVFKEKNIEVVHPLGSKKYTLDLQIDKKSLFYEYKDMETFNLSIKKIRLMEDVPFQIAPIITIRNLILKEVQNVKKLYMNFIITEAYIEFYKPSYPNDLINHWMHDIQIIESDPNNEKVIKDSDNESDDKII